MSPGFSDAYSPIAHHYVTPESCFSSSHLRSHPSDLWSRLWQEVERNSKSALTRQTSTLSAKYGIKARLKACLGENTSLLRAARSSRGNGIMVRNFPILSCSAPVCHQPGQSWRQAQTCRVHSSLWLNCALLGWINGAERSISASGSFPHWSAITLHTVHLLPCPAGWCLLQETLKGVSFLLLSFLFHLQLLKDSCYLTYGAYTICTAELLLQKRYKPILIRFMGNLPKANSSQLQLQSTPEIKGWQRKELSFFQHEI